MTSSSTNMSFLYGSNEVSNLNETRTFSYPLKSNNNIKEYSLNGKRTTASHNSEDQLIKLSGATNKDFQYTDDGFLKSTTSCKGNTLFDYDSFGNLKKVSLPDGKVIEYKVDGLNRRIKKLVNGQIKEYYLWYDQIHLAAILDENKQAKVKFIYSIDSSSASAIEKNGVLYKLIHDPGLGSIRYAINVDTQEIAQEIEYDELGNITYNSDKDFQPLAYAGGLFDADTGLTRFGARDYDPTVGRWTSKDPIGLAGGLNLYAYVEGNPLSYIDPEGLMKLPKNPSGLGPGWEPDPTHTPGEGGGRWRYKGGKRFLEFHPGKPGANGDQAKDHWHDSEKKKGKWVKCDDHLEPGDEVPDPVDGTAEMIMDLPFVVPLPIPPVLIPIFLF